MSATLNPPLSLLEARILGVLLEKELTVPDIHPLSLNALTAGCNQKNNRNPVMNTSEVDVQAAIDRLRPLALVIESSGSRVMRYSQNIGRVLKVPSEAVALLAALWLRGPQTAAELRAATERLHRFADVSSVEGFLTQLAERSPESGGPLVRLLPRAPGAREPRWVDLLSPAAESVNAVSTREQAAGSGPVPAWSTEVEQLRAELQALQERVERLENRGSLG
ncbi:MAG TPA: DUF480 domain-containing protein [Burkholderiaceae bacterium]|nr:DUF480 domain-containing protein [Burkholderiaceae bacterium]